MSNMPAKSKTRTPEEKLKKMLKEENTILDLELAIKKEKLKKKDEPNKMLKEENTVVDLELAVTKEKFKKKKKKKKFVGISFQNL